MAENPPPPADPAPPAASTGRRRTPPADDTGPETVQLSLTVTPDLRDRLRAAADERMLNPSVLATKALEDFLARLIPVADLQLTAAAGSRPTGGG